MSNKIKIVGHNLFLQKTSQTDRKKMQIIGIDPGARYTAVSVRDGNELLLSSTYVRPKEMLPVTWGVWVAQQIVKDVRTLFPNALIGIEGVTKPNPYHQGKLSLNNPQYLIGLSMVVGCLAATFPEAVIVRPRSNGSQPIETYPKELVGRRPKTLLGTAVGSGTRNHERSAWDVAGEAEYLHTKGYKLDEKQAPKPRKKVAPKNKIVTTNNTEEPEGEFVPNHIKEELTTEQLKQQLANATLTDDLTGTNKNPF